MEAPLWAAYAAAWLVSMALIVVFSNHLRRHPRPNPPPGPKPWPIIGNFGLIGPLPHHTIHELSKKYGPIMTLQLGSCHVVVASSVEMARLFLKTYDVAFAGRPKTAAGKYMAYDNSGIAWAQYGPYWRQTRKLCLMELFSVKKVESFEYIRVEELNSLLKRIFEVGGKKAVLLKDYLSTMNLNVINRMILGKTYFDNIVENSIVTREELKNMLDEFFLLSGVFNLGDWIPYLDFLDLQGYVKRMKVLAKKLDSFMEYVLNEHIGRRQREMGNWVPKDILDVLLELDYDPKLEVKFNRKGIKSISQDLIAGGAISSTVAIEWTMSELLRRPETIMKATEELDNIIGRERWIQEKDIKNLPYLRAIVKEAMRLHPVTPLLAPRMSREDVQIQGYDVPKGSIILVNTFSIQRDQKVYESPNEFWPERFIGKNIDVIGQDFELLPFGSGRRMCPGYSHGIKVIQSTLANLIHGFTWKLPNNMKTEDLNMDEIFGLVNFKKVPLATFAEPRLPHDLYHM